MQRVFVLDAENRPLMPCRPARARWLLTQQRAAVFRLAAVYHYPAGGTTRGGGDPAAAQDRSGQRHHRTRGPQRDEWRGGVGRGTDPSRAGGPHPPAEATCLPPGSPAAQDPLPPGAVSQPPAAGGLAATLAGEPAVERALLGAAVCNGSARLRRISQELVRFDTQLLQNPEIAGVEYQQGTWRAMKCGSMCSRSLGRTCVYCQKTDVPLELDHLLPRSRGGSNRVSNLAPACHPCNQKKGNRTAAEFGYPEVGGAGQGAPAGCGGGEQQSVGTVPPARGARSAAGDGQRREDQVEPA